MELFTELYSLQRYPRWYTLISMSLPIVALTRLATVKCTVAPTAESGGARLDIAHWTCGVNYDQGESWRAIKLTMVRQSPCSIEYCKRCCHLGTSTVRLTNVLRCHTVGTVAASNGNVLPEISCTTHDVISAKMAAGYLRVSRLVRLDGFRLPLTDRAFLDATRA